MHLSINNIVIMWYLHRWQGRNAVRVNTNSIRPHLAACSIPSLAQSSRPQSHHVVLACISTPCWKILHRSSTIYINTIRTHRRGITNETAIEHTLRLQQCAYTRTTKRPGSFSSSSTDRWRYNCSKRSGTRDEGAEQCQEAM